MFETDRRCSMGDEEDAENIREIRVRAKRDG